MKLGENEIKLVMTSSRGIPVRKFPSIIKLIKDTSSSEIVVDVMTTEEILASDIDLLAQM